MQDRRYFGLTTQQIGILAGLAGAACLLFGLTGWFVFRGGFSRPQTNMPVTFSTSTPFLLPTLTPTAIPTSIPYEQLVPDGWTQHLTTLVEIWLPPGFENAGSGAIGISGNTVIQEMALTGTTSDSSLYNISVNVAFEPLSTDSMDSFIEARVKNIPPAVTMTERRKVFINSTEAYRLMFESNNNNVITDDLLFVLLDGTTVWYVKYSAEIKDFYEMLPTFEKSIRTFRIVR